MKAVSYLRFSTPEQKLGDSTQRQLRTFRDWCKAHDLEPDETCSMADEGLSAFKGDHIGKGALGIFLAGVKAGKFPNHVLVAENLDRISRQGPKLARKIIEQIVDNGVRIDIANINVCLTPGWENDAARSIIVDVELGRAWKESTYKSDRVKSAWKAKKAHVAKNGNGNSDRLYTRKIPAWLKVVDGKIVADDSMVATIREMFRMFSLGAGTDTIARDLRERLTSARFPGRKLSRSWVVHTLRNRALLGEFRVGKDGDVIADYFPQIIDQSLFDSVTRTIEAKTKGRQYRGGYKKHGLNADNLFTGLLYDVSPSGDSTRALHFQKVLRGVYLQSAFDPKREANRMPYARLESCVLDFLPREDWQAVAGETESAEYKAASVELETVLREIDKVSRRIESTQTAMDADGIDSATITVLARKLGADEAVLATLSERRDALQSAVNTARAKCASLYNPDALIGLIKSNAPEATDIRLRLKSEIRKRVSRIELTFFRTKIVPSSSKEQDIAIMIHYVNGAVKMGWLGTKEQPSILAHNLYDIVQSEASKGLEALIERLNKELVVTGGAKV